MNGYDSVELIMNYDELDEAQSQSRNLKDIVDDEDDYDKLMREIKKMRLQMQMRMNESDPDYDAEDMGSGSDSKIKSVTLMGEIKNEIGVESKTDDECNDELIQGVVLMEQTKHEENDGLNENEDENGYANDTEISNLMGAMDKSEE